MSILVLPAKHHFTHFLISSMTGCQVCNSQHVTNMVATLFSYISTESDSFVFVTMEYSYIFPVNHQ